MMIKVAVGMAMVLALSLGGCASGPSDFVKMAKDTNTSPPVKLRSTSQQTALAAALSAQRRGGGSASDASGSEASLMALTVIRQQQNEEAQALLAEGGVSVPINKPACDPTAIAPALGACPAIVSTTQASAQPVK